MRYGFPKKSPPSVALGPLPLRLLFGEGASPREGGHRAAAKSTFHCSVPFAGSLLSTHRATATLRLRAALGLVHYDRCFGALSLD